MFRGTNKIIAMIYTILILILIFTIIAMINNKSMKEVEASSNANSTSDVQLIARAINGEARGEPYTGQVAVAAVVAATAAVVVRALAIQGIAIKNIFDFLLCYGFVRF